MKNEILNFSESNIKEEVAKISMKEDSNSCIKMIGFIDLTSLNTADNEKSVTNMIKKVNEFSVVFPGLPAVAGICVFPRFIPLVRKHLSETSVKIVSVAASFPHSQSFSKIKQLECSMAVQEGADEIDIVMSVGDFLMDSYDRVGNEISEIKKLIGERHLKVILETGILGTPERIYHASMIAMEAGADFIKTSTGKSDISATPEAAWIMCKAIGDYYRATGRMVGFKPAGGISSSPGAHLYMGIVEKLLGNAWLTPELFRIGASRLANDLLSRSMGKDIKYF